MASIGRMSGPIGTGPVSQILNTLLGGIVPGMGVNPDAGKVSHDPTDNQPSGFQDIILRIAGMLANGAKQGPPTPQMPIQSGGDPIQGIISALAGGGGGGGPAPVTHDPADNQPSGMNELLLQALGGLSQAASAGPPARMVDQGRVPPFSGAPDPMTPAMDAESLAAAARNRDVNMMGVKGKVPPARPRPPEGSDHAPFEANPDEIFPVDQPGDSPMSHIIQMMLSGDKGGTPVTPGMVEPPAVKGKVVNVDKGSVEPSHQDNEPDEGGAPDEGPEGEGAPVGSGAPSYLTSELGKAKSPSVADRSMAMAKDTAKREVLSQGPGEAASSGNNGTRYVTVKKGESLWKIAQREYGDGNKWKMIAKANKLNIKNPNLVMVGQRIVVPTGRGPKPPMRPGV